MTNREKLLQTAEYDALCKANDNIDNMLKEEKE